MTSGLVRIADAARQVRRIETILFQQSVLDSLTLPSPKGRGLVSEGDYASGSSNCQVRQKLICSNLTI
jgi:hypothetical protein